MAASFIFDPSLGETPQGLAEQRQRRRLAEALIKSGIDYSPVKSWTQGLARLAQAYVGGSIARNLDSQEKAAADSLQNLPGLSPGPFVAAPPISAAPATPSIPTEALSGAPVSETAAPMSGGMLASSAAPSAGVNVPEQYKPLVQSAAEKYGIPEGVLTRQLNTESRFNPAAVSPAGATGIAQFMPETAKDMGVNPADPASAIPGAARYVAENRDKYGGNLGLALAAYNWGPGNVDKWLASGADPSKMPAETRKYVETILGPDALSRPVQVASNDPNFAPMSPAPMAQAAGGNALAFNGQPQNANPLSTLPPPAGPQGFSPAAGPTPNITTIPVRPTQLAPAAVPAVQQAQSAPVPAAPQIPPAVAAYIRKAIANPYTRASGLALYSQYAKPRGQWVQQTNPDGSIVERNTLTGEMKVAVPGKKQPTSVMEYEYYRSHLPPGEKALDYGTWATAKARAGALQNNVQIDQRGESAFSVESAKLQAKRFSDLAADAGPAKQMMSDIETLRTLGAQIGTGKRAQIMATLGPYGQALGLDMKGLDEIQAYDAIVNRLAPSLRVKGSGAQSDFELRNFMKSLPSVGNLPGGNEIISQTLTGLYQNKLKAAEIGANALNGTISRTDAERQLRELPDPMQGYREFIKKTKPDAANKLKALQQKYGLE